MRRLWWIPLCFALVVMAVGAYAYRTLVDASQRGLRGELETILAADVAALRLWVSTQQVTAHALALDPRVVEATAQLVELADKTPKDRLGEVLGGSDARKRIANALAGFMKSSGYVSWGVLRQDGTVLAAPRPERSGVRIRIDFDRFERLFAGETTFTPPAVDDVTGEPLSLLRIGAPIRRRDGDARGGSKGEIIAALGFVVPARKFTEILQIARAGESGETYAFDAKGAMLSQSRFEAQLVELGLLQPGQDSVLKIQIRDPGGDLTQGFVPSVPMAGRPLTRMAAAAVSSGTGSDVAGYPDYRGVMVVGAWIWLPEFHFGVATEMDYAEAYSGLATVRLAFAVLAALLLAAAIGMGAYSVVIGRVERRLETARKLGRYRVVEKIGEGGMGKVYRAQHALLRRPTAVKVLDSKESNEEAVKRFEREVQATASLTHPNTIAIYDYGRTPDGSFYYAMEFLDGLTLGELVRLAGAQPEARVMNLLRQAAGSLAEAHANGIVHRDLKPSNIMLCSRGGSFDFVKVLDFGLARGNEDDLHLTKTQSLTGTPLYLSPEALESPEAVGTHSDVYQLGAIGYNLLTGRHVFEGENLVELLAGLLHRDPTPISEILGRDQSTELEDLLLACLDKDPARRPADASVLLELLEQCRVEGSWTQKDARAWWEETASERRSGDGSEPGTPSSLPSGWQVDLAARSD